MYRSSYRVLLLSLVVLLATNGGALAQAPVAGGPAAAQAINREGLLNVLSQSYQQVKLAIASRQIAGDQAARSLFEVLMLADVVGEPGVGNEIRQRLLLDYPATLQARYLVVQTPNETAYRQLLFQAWNSEPRELTSEFFRKFQGAVRLGAERWNAALFADDNFLTVSTLSAYQTGDFQFLAFLQLSRPKANSQTGKEPGETTTIALLDLAPRDKFLRLVPHGDQIGAADFCDYLYAQIPAAERDQTDIAESRVRQLMTARRYPDALPIAQKLVAADPNPSRLFWQAWALALTHKHDEALRALDAIDGAGKAHELADECKELRAAVTTLTANTDAHLKAVQGLIKSMARSGELQAIEAQVKFGERLEYDTYFGIDFGKKTIGIGMNKAGKPALICRLESGASKFYIRGEERVIAYRELDAFPVANASLGRAPNGAMAFNYNFNLVPASQAATSPLQDMLQSPLLADEKALQKCLENWVGQGWLPMPVEDLPKATGRSFRWISLDRTATGHQSYVLRLSPKGRLTSIKSQNLEVTALRYGQSGSFDLKLPTLPDVPVEAREKFDAASMIQMFGSAVKLFQDESSDVAARPK